MSDFLLEAFIAKMSRVGALMCERNDTIDKRERNKWTKVSGVKQISQRNEMS